MTKSSAGFYPQGLKQNPTWLQNIVDNIVDALLLVDHDGTIIAHNPAALDLFGYEGGELGDQSVKTIIPDLLSSRGEGREEVFITVGIGVEFDGFRKDSTSIPLRIDAQQFTWEGQLIHTLIVRDNTANRAEIEMSQEAYSEAIEALETEREINSQLAEENKQKAREIEKRRSQIRDILDTTADAIALASPEGVILNIDNQFSNFFNLQKDEAVGTSWTEFVPKIYQIFEDPQGIIKLLGGTAPDQELELKEVVKQVWPQPRELELTSRPVMHGQEHLGRLYVFRDVTHEREVDRMKTQFVSMVSHELRTPLTSIKGFTEMVLDEDAGEINEEQEEYLSIVLNNADRLIALVNDLLDVSRIESGRVELKIEPAEISDIVHITEATMGHLFEKKAQSFKVEMLDTLPRIAVDRDRIIQVLTNLVSNAYKYTPEGGHIRLTVTIDEKFARFSVIDDGFGISEADQEKLFTRFFRVDSALTREIGGTGLGLNIVKSIIEKHGGEIIVESELGSGSTFAFTVPLEARPIETSVDSLLLDKDSGVIAAHGETILVVEDEPDIAKLIQAHLLKGGYEVEIASSGEAALEKIEQGHFVPDLITLDIKLPHMSGLDFAAQLAGDPLTADIPILVISVYGDEKEEAQLGLVNRITKPIDRNQLLSKVAIMLESAEPGGTVLLIVNSDQSRIELSKALSQEGYEVIKAGLGRDGLDLAINSRPGLILLDIKLPDMSGTAVLQALKNQEETAGIPVIVASNAQGFQMSDRARVLALGAADFVSGPLDIDILLEEVRLFISEEEV